MDKYLKKQPVFHLENFDIEQKIVITYTEDEVNIIQDRALEEGRNQGFDEGFLKGKEEALTEHDLALQSLLMKMEQKMEEILQNQEEYLEKLEFNSKTLFYAFVKKMMPHYVKKYGLLEMENFMTDFFGHILRKNNITVNVHPNLKEPLKNQLISNGYNVDFLTFNGDEHLTERQIEIEWENGGARYDMDQIYTLVDDIFKPKIESDTLSQNA